MGVDCDAYLVFGVQLGGAWDVPDWAEDPKEKFGEIEGVEQPDEPYSDEVLDVYRSYWKACREAQQKWGLDICGYGYCDEPVYFLVVSEHTIRAPYGSFTRLELVDVIEDVDARRRLREFCRHPAVDIDLEESEVGWWLVNYLSV